MQIGNNGILGNANSSFEKAPSNQKQMGLHLAAILQPNELLPNTIGFSHVTLHPRDCSQEVFGEFVMLRIYILQCTSSNANNVSYCKKTDVSSRLTTGMMSPCKQVRMNKKSCCSDLTCPFL